MSKFRFGWPDLLLPLAALPALTGHFYAAMALLAVYAVLYHRASRRHRALLEAEQRAVITPLTPADVGRIFDIPDEILADLPTRPKP